MARARRPSASGREAPEARPGGDPPVRPPRPLREPPARVPEGGPGRRDMPGAPLAALGTLRHRPRRAVSPPPPRLGLHVSGPKRLYFETFV